MPRQEHILRQVDWQKELSKFGKTTLEKSLQIRGAEVFVDVYAKIGSKEYLIEIGDIADKRKEALLEIYAEHNPRILFIHENYGQNRIPEVLKTIERFRNSSEGRISAIEEELASHKYNELHRYRRWGAFLGFAAWVVSVIFFAIGVNFNSGLIVGLVVIGGSLVGWLVYPFIGYIFGSLCGNGQPCNCQRCRELKMQIAEISADK